MFAAGIALQAPPAAAAGGFTRTQIATYAFPDVVGVHPAAFTDLNNNNGQLRVTAGATYSEAFAGVASESIITAGNYSNDQFFSVVVSGIGTGTNGDEIGGVLRASADTNPNNDGYRVYFRNDATNLVRCDKVTNGVVLNLYSVAHTLANGNRIEGEIRGTTLNILKSGTLLHSFTDASFATGRPGIYGKKGGSETLRGGNWLGGDVT